MRANRETSECESLYDRVIHCRKCPRLVDFRENVRITSRIEGEEFWRKPVPGYGERNGSLMIVGLAPAASGGNRTGRVFTGDKSGDFLTSALFQAGFTNQEFSISRDDGLEYFDTFVTAAVKCVPPENKPTREEQMNCLTYLSTEMSCMPKLSCILALGRFAFQSVMDSFRLSGMDTKGMKFEHGKYAEVGGIRIYSSFHPSPRNVNTGRLSRDAFLKVLQNIKDYIH